MLQRKADGRLLIHPLLTVTGETYGNFPKCRALSEEELAVELDLPAFYLHTSGTTGLI
jgi:acyl-coenzyme A synthetase/AMP-(fatty) acid ligase